MPPGRLPDYGLDAPIVLRRLAIGGTGAIVCGLLLMVLGPSPLAGAVRLLRGFLLGAGAGLCLAAVGMLWGSRVGKLRLRDRVIESIPWRGDERVLDIGCGHGLMLIAAAKRLRSGRAVGIDLWSSIDQAANSPEATRANARAEGVEARVEVRDGDARDLPFPDGSFDVVLSSYALHNIEPREQRQRAVREAVRVLARGGRLAIMDIWYVREYRRILADAGMLDVRLSLPRFYFGPPSLCLTAQKPGGTADRRH